MHVAPIKTSDKYSVEWFALKAMSGNRALQPGFVDELYWLELLNKYPHHEQNILEAKELIHLLSNIRFKVSTPFGQEAVWKKILKSIEKQ